jgi:hypothetical protein
MWPQKTHDEIHKLNDKNRCGSFWSKKLICCLKNAFEFFGYVFL